jgi:hypothetical protein
MLRLLDTDTSSYAIRAGDQQPETLSARKGAQAGKLDRMISSKSG